MLKTLPIVALLGVSVLAEFQLIGDKVAVAACNLGHEKGNIVCLSTVSYTVCPDEGAASEPVKFKNAKEVAVEKGKRCVQGEPGKSVDKIEDKPTNEKFYFAQWLTHKLDPNAPALDKNGKPIQPASSAASSAGSASATPSSAAGSSSKLATVTGSAAGSAGSVTASASPSASK